jgi:Zn-dependent peptidase ImmA (M78 family)
MMMPSSTVLLSIAQALSLRPEYFFDSGRMALRETRFRKRCRVSKRLQKQILEETREHLERHIEIEQILGITFPDLPRHDLRCCREHELPDRVEAAALDLRHAWELGCDPLPSVMEILEDRGVKVVAFDTDKTFDGLSGWADMYPFVAVANWLDADKTRKRFTVLHELAHLVLDFPANLGPKAQEKLCHRFAGAILMPKKVFIEEIGKSRERISVGELEMLKRQWGIPMSAIMHRAYDLGVISRASYTEFCKWANRTGFRTKEPDCWVGCETSHRFERLVYRAMAQELISRSKASSLLGRSLADLDRPFATVA